MRPRTIVALAMMLSLFVLHRAPAQEISSSTAGLVRGDYVRASFGVVAPVNPSGSLKDWKSGQSLNVMWENWDNGGNGLGIIGFGLYGDLALLPFDADEFKAEFTNGPFGRVTSASASRARVIQVGVNTRFRIPMPYVMPSIALGIGFLDWHPGQIDYTAERGSASAKQQNRQGGVVSLAGALDRVIYDRYALFAEAVYAYGYTSFGQGLAASGSQCVLSNCDLLKNTPLGVIRGGLRARVTR